MNATFASYRAHDVGEHLLRSSIIEQVFRIEVAQPISRVGERFPVVYTTDSDDFFAGFATLANHLHIHAETPRFILVGIGYENSRASALLRQRDLHSHSVRRLYKKETEQIAASGLAEGIDDLNVITETTDALQFLQFIREELMPFIDANYPTLGDDNSYSGYSAGGAFGLYTLFTRPDTFKRYVIGSPATSYEGQHFGIEMAKSFIASGRSMEAKVFMCVGELEEFKRGFGQFDLVTGYFLMAKFLKKAAIPGLDLITRVFPDETHATAWTLAFSHGLKALLGPAGQVPFLPDYLK